MIGIVPGTVSPQVSVALKFKVTVVPDRSENGKVMLLVVVVTEPEKTIYDCCAINSSSELS
ncbi:hypothetical protein DPMN_094029 [Dreissena polymorpha]|uniref:Uncharacterized protein n=1 Tax=Dreissena polymorpha TaxID=45954 RepID=A0A9D4L6N5_DREPO|nr:hypothetical protein DPMN_094029 [Dreissena polymorpha]